LLPDDYKPMSDGVRFNSNDPLIVPDAAEMSRLRVDGPQWLVQFLNFPPPSEIVRHLGDASPDTRRKAAESVAQVLNPRFLPDNIMRHLVPMASWAVLYKDWMSHGGTDLFLTKFVRDGHALTVGESHNHIIVLIRNLESGQRVDDIEKMKRRANEYANSLFNEHLKPASPDSLRLFQTSITPPFVYGYYTPKIEALTGGLEADASTSPSVVGGGEGASGARASSVRFFCNGDFAAFFVLKPAFTGALKNPFEPRFTALNMTREDSPFWERRTASGKSAASDQVVRRQVEEYLGSYFFDEQGNRLSDKVTYKDLERAYLELSPEQRLAIVEQKIVDEYYSDGMKAFVAEDFQGAVAYWTRILQLEPDNPRAAILLQVAVKQRADKAFKGDVDRAKRDDKAVGEAMDAISRQQTILSLRKEQKTREQVKERAVVDYRTRALNFLSEGNYPESLKEWKKLLGVDPGNASALFFQEICEDRVRSGTNPAP
jgi:hypothetical protein